MGLIDAWKSYRESRLEAQDDHATGLTLLDLKSVSFQSGQSSWLDHRGNYLSPYQFGNTNIDFGQAVGDLRTSTLIMAAFGWVAKNFFDPRLNVVDVGQDNKETEIQGHELSSLFYKPNPVYSGHALAHGFALSWVIATEAYFLKERSKAGRVVGLWWEPHWTIRPRWPEDGSEFISFYEVHRGGRWIRVEKEDVIPFVRIYDPETRRAISPMMSLLREFYTDQQIAQFMALIFKNGLVPPLLVTVGDKERPFNGDLKAVKAEIARRMSGDSAGEPLVTNDVVHAEKLGFDYTSMGLKEMREIPEDRFCAVLGISQQSLRLGSGRQQSTYNNTREYRREDFEQYIMPLQRYVADELTNSLLPDFGEVGTRKVTWDYSQVQILQPDQDKLFARVGKAYNDNILKRSEAREAIGYKWEEGVDDKYASEMGGNIGASLLEDFERGGGADDPLPLDEDVKPNGKVRM